MEHSPFALTTVFAVAVLAIAGCGDDGSGQGPAQQTGKAVDHAADKTGETLKEGAQKTGEAVKEGAEKTGEAVEKAGDKVKDATTK